MRTPEEVKAAEEGVRTIVGAIGAGGKVSPDQVTAIAGLVLGAIDLVTNTTWRAVEAEAKAQANAEITNADQAEEAERNRR